MPQGLTLTLLGGLHIERDGAAVEGLLTSKAAALLAYLVVTGRPQPRSVLAGLFWGESPEESARASLRTALSTVNRVVGPYLQANYRTVQVDPGRPCWSDVAAFGQAVSSVLEARAGGRGTLNQAQAQALQSAVNLYRGEFLAGCAIYDAPLFEEWLLAERERLHQLAWQSMFVLSAYYAEIGAYGMGIEVARRLLALEPWHEEAHRQLMRLLALSGQRSAALAQYETCRRVLNQELGALPMPETTLLARQIEAGELLAAPAEKAPGPTLASAHYLPRPLTPFIGRDEELVRLRQLLLDPSYRLVTIVGAGGVGKSRLALAAAEQVAERFADGAWFVPLAAVVGPAVGGDAAAPPEEAAWHATLAQHIAAALGYPFLGQRAPQDELLDYLRRKDMLLLLDSMEHLLPGRGLLLEIVEQAPRCTVLVTSRERLNFQAEYVFRLKGMPVPDDAQAPGVADYGSIRLFAERAARTSDSFRLAADNLPDVVRICRLVDGLPLGVELAATWVERLGCAGIADTIVQRLDFLETTLGDLPQRHRSMRAVFDFSWQLLSPADRALLARCAVFQGGFGEAAARAVIEALPAGLQGLVEKSLLQQVGDKRYDLHDLLRQFLEEKQDRPLPTGRVTEGPAGDYARHSAYYLDLVARRQEDLLGPRSPEAMREIWLDWGNVRRAWLWAVDRGHMEAIRRGGPALAAFCQRGGLLREGVALLARAAERLQALPPEGAGPEVDLGLATVLVAQAGLLNAQGWSERAAAAARQAAQLAQRGQATDLEAGAHLQRGVALARQLDYAGARHCGRLAQTLAREAGAHPIEADSQLLLGQVERTTGDCGVAQVYYEEALRLYQQIGDRRGEGVARMQIGDLAAAQGRLDAARRHYERAQALLHEVAERQQEGAVLESLARVAAQGGDYAAAWACDEQALAILGEVGDRQAEGSVLSDMGAIQIVLGQYAAANKSYEQARHIWHEIGYRQGEAQALEGLGRAAGRQGDYAAAETFARQALAIAKEAGERSALARATDCLGQALAGQGRWEEAAAAYWTALAQRRELGEQAAAIESLAGLAEVALAQGDLAQARAHVGEILDYHRGSGIVETDDPLRVYLACYRVLEALGDERAETVLRTAHGLLHERAARLAAGEQRRVFMEEVAVHREIEQAYARRRSRRYR